MPNSKEVAASARSLADDCDEFADEVDPPATPTAPDEDDAKITKLIVAVHGIGDQFRFATIQSVVRRIVGFCDVPVAYPLGRFHAPGREIRATPFEFDIPKGREKELEKFVGLGFAEVFWADIHQEAQKTKDTIEESKSWAQTMVDRMRALDKAASPSAEGGIPGEDDRSVNYDRTAAVVKEMIETIATLENLCLLASKMGLGKFELRSLLDDYLGAVQLVAEFKDYGGRIFGQFTKIMRALVEKHKNLREIYIVAHSEGTVVSFHSLLAALADRGGEDEKWVKLVRGYMTIGSPIDKHIVMWQDLWKDFYAQEVTGSKEGEDEKLRIDKTKRRQPWVERGVQLAQPIVWWNYYDYGDPVGFVLDSTRLWLQDHLWVTVEEGKGAETGKRVLAKKQPFFDFRPEQDIGFARYYLPGKAHNDYWGDPGVFGHFIAAVVEPVADCAVPKSEFWPRIVSWIVPYVLCLLILGGGTYLIYSAIDPLLKPKPVRVGLGESIDNLKSSAAKTAGLAVNIAQAVVERAETPPDKAGVVVPVPAPGANAANKAGGQQESLHQTCINVFALTFLLAGITVASRIPRLVKQHYWHLVSVAVFLVGAISYFFGVSDRVGGNLAAALPWLPVPENLRLILLALVVAIVSCRISRMKPDWGMQPLMGAAAVATLVIIVGLKFSDRWGGVDTPLWPLVLAGAAFIYLWWLAALIFDLVFVWHRYIRLNTTPELLWDIGEKWRTDDQRRYSASVSSTVAKAKNRRKK